MMGALLCRGGVTVCACLRAVGVSGQQCFGRYHRLLSRDRMDLLQGAKTLVFLLLKTALQKVDHRVIRT